MSLQPYFDEFHEQIKLSDENSDLRTSRDAIKKTLSNGLKELADEGITLPSFFDQSSYAMGTGTKPLSGKTTFDIDEGVIFDISKDDYPDPTTVKTWLAEALEDQTSLGTEIKEPCVRVVYSEGGDEKYHVDLAVYARVISESDAPLYLARGKKHSLEENKYWDISDPVTLKNLINNRFSDKNAAQFKRIIRYLKRWKDVQFHYAGKGKPTGISLTVAAYYRNLETFVSEGVAKKVDLQGGKYYYEKASDCSHLICDTCRKVEHIHMEENHEAEHTVVEKTGFRISQHVSDFFGTCKTCQTSHTS